MLTWNILCPIGHCSLIAIQWLLLWYIYIDLTYDLSSKTGWELCQGNWKNLQFYKEKPEGTGRDKKECLPVKVIEGLTGPKEWVRERERERERERQRDRERERDRERGAQQDYARVRRAPPPIETCVRIFVAPSAVASSLLQPSPFIAAAQRPEL